MSEEFKAFLHKHYGFVPYPIEFLPIAKAKMCLMRYASGMTQVPDMWGTELLAIRDYMLFLESELGYEIDPGCFGEARRLGSEGAEAEDPKTITELFEGTRTIQTGKEP